ncbi:four-jointed box protein 1-like [Saccoglossus kowalevskii]
MSDDGRRWMAILSDDSQYIARQVNCELRSELLAFHLSQLMGMDSVPFATLSKINLNSGLWKGVQVEKKEKKPSSKRMPDPPTDGDIVSLTQWIEGLKKGPMLPGILLDRIYRAIGEPLFADDIYLEYLSKEEITQLVQWTDMILFDYINVNYDRSFPWLIIHGPSSQQPTNNVYRIGYGIEKLYFSNHAQTFVWSYAPFPSDPRIREHHDLMLHSSCIFRKSVADKIAEMNTHENPVKLLLDRVNAEEPLANITEPVPGCFVDDVKFGKILQKRLSEINTWITSCKDDYDRRKRQV